MSSSATKVIGIRYSEFDLGQPGRRDLIRTFKSNTRQAHGAADAVRAFPMIEILASVS
jgi:hypothetical protein